MKRVLDYLRFGAINKILPLTYDDSLSYYEMCCKMLSKINEIVAAYNDNFSDMVKDEIINNLNKIMLERKTHEILRDRAFENFKKELAAQESKEIDELISYTFNKGRQ